MVPRSVSSEKQGYHSRNGYNSNSANVPQLINTLLYVALFPVVFTSLTIGHYPCVLVQETVIMIKELKLGFGSATLPVA